MTLNPKITDPDKKGDQYLEWTPDPTAEGYAFVTPGGKSRTFDPTAKRTRVRKATEPIAKAASVAVLDVTQREPQPDRYDIVIVAGWQADTASKLPATTKTLLYTSDVSCDMRQTGVDYFYGVAGPDAIANGWALKDTSGAAVVHNSGYINSVLADPSLSAYQDRWAANVIGFCKQHNMDGIQIDDVDGVRKHYFSSAVAKFPSDQLWQDAHAAFHAAVVPRLRAAGLFVVSNTAGTLAFLTRVARLTDSVMIETYQGQADTVQAVNAGGAIAMPLSFTSPDTCRAAFKKADRGDGVFLYEPAGGGDPWGTWCSL